MGMIGTQCSATHLRPSPQPAVSPSAVEVEGPEGEGAGVPSALGHPEQRGSILAHARLRVEPALTPI